MDTSNDDVILLFNISTCSAELRAPSRNKPWANFAIVAYNQHIKKIIVNYYALAYGDTSHLDTIELDGKDFEQFLLIQELPWHDIVNYFRNK